VAVRQSDRRASSVNLHDSTDRLLGSNRPRRNDCFEVGVQAASVLSSEFCKYRRGSLKVPKNIVDLYLGPLIRS
jgi:hypothetical protein